MIKQKKKNFRDKENETQKFKKTDCMFVLQIPIKVFNEKK